MRARIGLLTVCTFLAACGECDDPETTPATIDESVFAEQLGLARVDASAQQLETFERGREVALRRFSQDEGLGPAFNVSFCGSCHEGPTLGGSSPRYRDFLLVGSRLDDGSYISLGVNGVLPQFSLMQPHRAPTPDGANAFANRSAIPFFGVGAIAALDERAILANADELDADGDGISGRPNYDRGFVGRFGRKSQTVSIEGFIRGPLFNHLGLTSEPLSDSRKAALPVPSAAPTFGLRDAALGCINCQAAAPEEPTIDTDPIPDPELAENDLFDLVSFAMLLGAPKPDPLDEAGLNGQVIFEQIQCAACHVPTLEGRDGLVPLYSDLLLHDMGEAMADGVSMGVATGAEYRTQPLWGVSAVGPFLHDGRADTLDEAIRWHGGEAQDSRDMYEDLSEEELSDLMAFIVALGGASQRSDGLLPPDAPVPAAGDWGGPMVELESAEATRFLSGRAAFDRDTRQSEGLGLSARFNGDSCRACHFEPTIGGAGPVGVNVTRQGILGTSGDFTAPDGGTMVHRFGLDQVRPEPDAAANVFELRQTPPLFGLGLIDQIPDETIAALADPDDQDGDGVRGRVHRLGDGRVGKFGWKAGIATLEDFVRDALSNEVGLTLPADSQYTAGIASDEDEATDPEFAGAGYEDMVFYVMQLGPPPIGELDSAGESLFAETGCASCHTPELATASGTAVRLYSDLLLHDVAPPDYRGIADGQASTRDFRTPPLWGVGRTGPYMHDGLSGSIDHAIRRHMAEAEASRTLYEGLSEDDREALLAFVGAL